MPLYFVLVNLAAFTGMAEAALGRRFSVWEIPVLSRGSGGSQKAQDAAKPLLPGATAEDRGVLAKHSASTVKTRKPHAQTRRCIFSVDVEDWFHILDLPSTPPVAAWDCLQSRVELNFLRLLDIFSEAKVSVTCFFLGWVARKFPHLVREARRREHEIASHGYAHQLAYQMAPDKFGEDALVSKRILEDAIGSSVLGYRAAGFSVIQATEWYFEKLIEAGYRYDSSVFPAPRGHGGMPNGHYDPYFVSTPSGDLLEFPISVKEVLGRPMCFFGGGYLRLFPYFFIKRAATSILEEGRSVTFYVHPREIDPEHPRLPMQLTRRFKSYVNLQSTEPKIRRLLADFEVTTFRDFISNAPHAAVDFSDRSLLETLLTRRETSAH